MRHVSKISEEFLRGNTVLGDRLNALHTNIVSAPYELYFVFTAASPLLIAHMNRYGNTTLTTIDYVKFISVAKNERFQ